MTTTLEELAAERLCYLETNGRTSGQPHEIEIWFAVHDGAIYMLAGGGERADWVKNLRKNPAVRVRVADTWFPGRARVITGEANDPLARRLLKEKYRDPSDDLESWARNSTPVAIEVIRAQRGFN